MIGKITGGSIGSLTATLSKMTDLGSFVVIREGASEILGDHHRAVASPGTG